MEIASGNVVLKLTTDDLKNLRNQQIDREHNFFECWKQCVEIAGIEYFGDGTKQSFESAATKWDLEPSVLRIENKIRLMSRGEAAFIASMVSFYNDIKGGDLSSIAKVKSIGDLSILDAQRRELIACLLTTYCGW